MLIRTKKTTILCIKIEENVSEPAELLVTGKNLVRSGYRWGYLKTGEEELQKSRSGGFLTTKWFPVDDSERFLVLSGDAYNRGVWQFELQDGKIVCDLVAPARYRVKDTSRADLTFPRVRIPEGAVRARVFFARTTDPDTAPLGKRLQVEYGRIPTLYEKFSAEKIALPQGKAGALLVYADGSWYLIDAKQAEEFERVKLLFEELERQAETGKNVDVKKLFPDAVCLKKDGKKLTQGSSIFLTKKTTDRSIVQIKEGLQCLYPAQVPETEMIYAAYKEKKEPIRTGVYGIRYLMSDPVPVCERTYDAVGLQFNCRFGEDYATPYANDFDHIYPWSNMRRCAVSYPDGKRKIIYEGQKGYRTDGSAGEVMVEIPKHYVRRNVVKGYEELEISAEPRAGFVLDPSFLTKEGEQDAIYVGAYFASVFKNEAGEKVLGSRRKRQVSIFRTGKEFVRMAEANPGFEEQDLCSALTVARLFVVESALLDAKAAMDGAIYLPYMISNKTSTYYSLDTVQQTNTIRLVKNSISQRYQPGDAVALMSRWKDYYSGKFANYGRVVTERKEREDGTVEITFSGKPVDLVEHDTGITGLPAHTGVTEKIPYPSGAKDTNLPNGGHDSFKYRGIENVWGGVWVVLRGCSVTDSVLTVEYPDGTTAQLDYQLPEQKVELTSGQFGDPLNMCVKRMGYDKKNPLISLPAEIGNGAITSTWYCTAWYNQAEPGKKYILTYGGAWDNKGYAGVYSFRASFTEDQNITFNGARLMCNRSSVIAEPGAEAELKSEPIVEPKPEPRQSWLQRIFSKGRDTSNPEV